MVDTVEKAIYELGVRGQEQFDRAAQSVDRLAVSEEKVTKATRTTVDGLEKMIARLDQRVAAERRLQAQLDQIARYEREGIGTTERRAQATALATQRYNDQIVVLNKATGAHNDNIRGMGAATVSTNQLRFATQNLAFQVNDIATSLASGGGFGRVIAQQAGQVIQAFQQGGGVSAVLGAAAASIRSMITPTVLVAAGLGAVGAGAFAVLTHTANLNREMRLLNQTLDVMGTRALVGDLNLSKVVRDLTEMGIKGAEARTALSQVFLTTGVNPALAPRIVATGANIAAVQGGDAASRAAELTKALAGGPETLIRLGIAIHAFDAAEAANLRTMAQHGQVTQALNRAFEEIERTYAGKLKNTLTDTARTFDTVASAAGRMWDAIGNSSAAQGALRSLEHAFDMMTALAQGRAVFLNVPGYGQVPLTSAGRAAIDAAQGAAGAPLPGASNTFDPRGVALNTEALQRLAAVLDAAVKYLPPGYAALATSGVGDRPGTPGSMHPGGNAIDIQLTGPNGPIANRGADTTGYYAQLAAAAYLENQRRFPGTSLAWGGRFGVTPGSSVADLMHFDTGPDRGTLGPPLSELAGRLVPWSSPMTTRSASAADQARATVAGGSADVTTGMTEEAKKNLGDLLNLQQRLQEAQKQMGEPGIWWRTYYETLGSGAPTIEKIYEAQARANDAVEKNRIELGNAAKVQDTQTQGVIRATDAFRQSEAAGYGVVAAEQARVEVMQRGGDAGMRTRQILEEGAAAAIQAGQKTVAAALPQVAAQERLAEAAKAGGAAQHEAELQAQAASRTQDALAKAEASRNPGLIAQAKALDAAALAEARRADAARQSTGAFQASNDNKRALEAVQLEASLQGQSTDEISRQLAMLSARQRLATDFANASDEAKKSYQGTTAALAEANVRLSEARQNQQRWDDAIRSVAATIESTIGQAIQDAFDGKRVTDWASLARSAMSSITSQLINAVLVRPAIGSALGGLGFGAVAQQYGGSSSGGGLFNFSNVSSAASLANTASGGGGGMFGNLFSGGLGGLFAHTPTAADFAAGVGPVLSVPGSLPLIGGLSAGTALGGIGLLAGAGFLISQLFGNKRPSNQSAGALLDTSTGRFSGAFAGGNSQIDSATQQLVQGVSAFTQNLLKLSGGQLSGNILLQGGVNTGFTADSTLAGYPGRFSLGKDAANAGNLVQLAIARSLTGITDTMKTVINSVADPAQLESAIQFAAVYDNLKTAADDAFRSIEDASKQDGPFAQAKQQIVDTFKTIADQATGFGLALDPVNAGLAEATRRLTVDFNQSIQDATLAITDSAKLTVQQERLAGEARVREAVAVNGDIAAVNQLNAMKLDEIWKSQTASLSQFLASLRAGPESGLTVSAQLKAANDNFAGSLALVRGGNLSEIGNLAASAQSAYGLSRQAYGFGPQTIALRDSLIASLDQVLAGRSFAAGGVTPPGWSRVGERGPEWLYSPSGGMTVLPSGTAPASADATAALLRAVLSELKVGNGVLQGGLYELLRAIQAQLAVMQRPVITGPERRAA